MSQTPISTTADPDVAKVLSGLAARLAGEVRADKLTRALYATDASIYEIVPDGVVFPRTMEDVQEAVRACADHRVAITARGAGTGLAGGCVNRGLQLDCSRHLHRILHIDPMARTALVEPGVVLDDLNSAAGPHGLHFAPDVATSSRATIGGMIANNSCGAHSVLYGRTVDHVLAVDVVLADGTRQTWGAVENDELRMKKGNGRDNASPFSNLNSSFAIHQSDHGARCERILESIARDYSGEIAARFPKVMRRNGGYALDRLRNGSGRINAETIICGSEGTLGIVVLALLRLTPLPRRRGLIVAHFSDLLDALAATPVVLQHGPAAVELIDKLILDAAREHPAMRRRPWLVEGSPEGVLIIELFDDEEQSLRRRLDDVAADLRARSMGYAWTMLLEPVAQEHLWNIRKNGLGLLMSRPGDRQAYDFVEDTAVEPGRLREYIERFMKVLNEEGVQEASYYAHASVGCLHVKPVLNLKSAGDVEKMHRIADRISSLALEFGGTMTGEHGDGILRSCWLEKMYGPRIVEAFCKIKTAFDPAGILNPGKIVDPLPMVSNFRFGPDYQAQSVPTTLDFDAYGGMAGLAEMCSGVGQCRQRRVGTMCPSYMATLDEKDSTRGRANALRLALSHHGLLDGLSDPALGEVMDLCISCKACKTQCPTGVDMARLKAEWSHQGHRRSGMPLRSRLIARMADFASSGSRCAWLANPLLEADWLRGLLDRFLAIDRRVALPRLARQSFRRRFARCANSRAAVSAAPSGDPSRRVVYFVDTWTNYFTPHVGLATVAVLESLGYEVIVPPTTCCGRPAISKGDLDHAARLARLNAKILQPFAESGIPIVGTEPSCILTFVDEFPQLVRTANARRIADRCQTIETFLAREPSSLQLLERWGRSAGGSAPQVLYHAHCHQKALVGTEDAMKVLRALCQDRAREIDSGCCGMAGSFGHEKEHYDVARAIGEDRLFPAVRGRGSAEIAVSGFSCRHQIAHHTGAAARHLVELVVATIGPKAQARKS